jgi:phosphoenolpyruvate-protein kinase (PTS system EI component)
MVLGADSEWLIPLAVGVGISELILPPYHVAPAKGLIPYLSYEQCREMVHSLQFTDDVSRNRQKARRFYHRLQKQMQNE